jgi:hypothetical protein
LIIHLKSQIENLVRFFQAVSSTLKVVVKLHVNPFIETIQTSVAADGTDPNKRLVVGGYMLADYQRTVRTFMFMYIVSLALTNRTTKRRFTTLP